MLNYTPVKVLFEFGNFQAHSYGLMLALAFLVGILIAVKEAKKRKIDAFEIYLLGLISIVSSIIGARLLYILVNLSYYSSNPLNIFAVQDGGLVFYGGFIFAIIACIIYIQLRKQKILFFFDLVSPSIIFGLAITRIGCFLNWCCYGIQSNLPWAIKVGDDVARHPTQIYSMVADFAIFLFLFNFNKKRKKLDGSTTGLFFILYGTFRFLIEFIRYYENAFYLCPFTISQIISLGLIAIGIFILKKRKIFK